MKRFLLASFALALSACTSEEPATAVPTAPKPASQPVAAASQPLAAASQPASSPEKPATVASGPRVVAVEGEATVDGQKAVIGTPVSATALIETQANAKIVITLEPGNIVQIRQNARVELGRSERKDISLKLLAGAAWSFLQRGSSFEVVAPNMVAGVRGTIFYVESAGDTQSYVCDCDGQVDVQTGKKKRSLRSRMQHTGVHVLGNATKVKTTPEKKALNHTKEEAIALETLAKTIE